IAEQLSDRLGHALGRLFSVRRGGAIRDRQARALGQREQRREVADREALDELAGLAVRLRLELELGLQALRVRHHHEFGLTAALERRDQALYARADTAQRDRGIAEVRRATAVLFAVLAVGLFELRAIRLPALA